MPLLIRLMAIILIGVAISLPLAIGLPQRADYTGQTITNLGYVAPETGRLAPPFSAQTADQESISLLDLRGKTVIINFWTTWCEPCRIEMPELQEIHESYQDTHQLTIMGINLGEEAEQIQRWQAGLGISFDLLMDPQGQIASLYRLRGQPMTFIINPEGIITQIFFGPVNAETIRAHLSLETEQG